MKENVLDILMYLFENYISDEVELEPDEESLRSELISAGFRGNEIEKAFDWLEDLATMQEDPMREVQVGTQSLRIYTAPEMERLDSDGRGFLLFLEQLGVLDPISRELVIDRIMALEAEEIDLDQLKWVVLMVLFNLPGQEAAYAWMEDLVFNEMPGTLH
jgi:Smg protein